MPSSAGAYSVTTKLKTPQASEFRKFMDSLGASKYAVGDKVQPGNMGNIFTKYISDNEPTSYDTYHTTEYNRQLDKTYGDAYMKQIIGKAGTKKGKKVIESVEFAGRDGWKKVKDSSVDDLKDYTVTDVMYSKYGNTAIL